MFADTAAMFLLGVFGTGHCVGMCGGLVLVFPSKTDRFSCHLTYHAGRICVYSLIGVFLTTLTTLLVETAQSKGDPIAWLVPLQVLFSVLAGLFLFWMALVQLKLFPEPAWMAATSIKPSPWIRRLSSSRLPTSVQMTLLGGVNGLLPCGLSYAAFARVLAPGAPLQSAWLLLIFGLGTLPGLLMLGTAFSRFARQHQQRFDILAAMVMAAMAVSLLATGFSSLR